MGGHQPGALDHAYGGCERDRQRQRGFQRRAEHERAGAQRYAQRRGADGADHADGGSGERFGGKAHGGAELASESIVAAFGAGLTDGRTQVATSLPLPTTLAGTRVLVRDSAGVERDAPLFFVAPAQVNYLIPAGTAAGAATVTITSGDGKVSTGVVQIAAVAPGLVSANASGQGVAAGVALRVKADGTQSYEPIAEFNQAQNRFVAKPIDLGPDLGNATDQVFLILYGTGFRNRSALAAVACKIGGADAEVLFAGAAPSFVGLDQSNVRLPRSLGGRGEVDVVMTVDGKAANTVRVAVK